MLWLPDRPEPVRGRLSQRLEILAHMVFGLFLWLCIVPIWPIRALDPVWLLSLGHRILQLAVLALMGIAVLDLARQVTPWRRHLRARRSLILNTASWISKGFLLTIPLQILLAWQARMLMSVPQQIQLFNSFSGEFQPFQSSPGPVVLALAYGVAFHLAGRRPL